MNQNQNQTPPPRRGERVAGILWPHHASVEEVELLADLLQHIRPDWDPAITRIVLLAHRDECDATDLILASVRAARTASVREPRWIMHRGAWWESTITQPADVSPRVVCRSCGKPEARCWTERPGRGDDHQFEPGGLKK